MKTLITIIVILATAFALNQKFNLVDISITNTEEIKQEENPNENTEPNITEEQQKETENYNYVEIYNKEQKIIDVKVELAQTDTEKQLGLSNRKYLGTYNGMLFIFNKPTEDSFWMKDMLILLDIIFIDESNFIVDIKENQQPCTETECKSIVPLSEYKYVLEVNANFCKENGIVIGNSIIVNLQEENN